MPGAAPPHSLYYFHHLLAGPPDGWPDEFARIAALGFDAVVLAPPFATGRDGSVFLAADHGRLHAALGGGPATEGLSRFAAMAREAGLALLLDLTTDRLDSDAVLLREHPEWALPDPRAELPPDPRQEINAGRRVAAPRDWWRARMAEWAAAGVAGFRCLDAGAGGAFWGGLIRDLREDAAQLTFIAWTQGTGAAQAADLEGCGFDLVSSSLPWWDYRAAWLGEEARRLARIAPPLAMPETPFARRLAANSADRRQAVRQARRALRFAALSGSAWLMPMGFEFGDLHRMGHGMGQSRDFAALRQAPRLDLREAVREANQERRTHGLAGKGALLSGPGSPVTVLGTGSALLLANPSLTRPAAVAPSQLLTLLPEPASGPEAPVTLAPGEVRMLAIRPTRPVILRPEASRRGASAAAAAPRIAIEAVRPAVDAGRFPVKRIVGHPVTVTADVFTDGATKLAVRLLWRPANEKAWREVPMRPGVNDSYAAEFVPDRVGRHLYGVCAWVDFYAAFLDEITKKHAAGVDIALERQEGMALLEAARTNLPRAEAAEIAALLKALPLAGAAEAVELFAMPRVITLTTKADRRPFETMPDPLVLDVERRAAGFASWYEIFPRSQSGDPARHGTFDDVIAQLPRVREMGFDVLYFPPIHPIGRKNRKGRNNSLTAGPDDPGSPYAIGAEAGGHDAVQPELGTLEDFRRLVAAAAEHGLELALDFAIQCSPDHPWLREHPGWFAYRPDGSIRFAENPPKKYEDIVNVDFYARDAVPELWIALRDVVLLWAGMGVKLFRVDNPHTKPLPFWEWMIAEVRARDPDCVFLSEAFTRPKVMYRLAKAGFSQSYTYFTWRNEAWELGQYMRELNEAPVADFFRPHFFVNTPDINPTFLQHSGRPGHLIRAALAATLSGLWGVYNGFELCEATPVKPGKEEYLDSEKYELRAWDHDRPGHIRAEITALNRLRRENPALQSHLGTTILNAGHGGMMLFAKATPDRSNIVLVAVTMDPRDPIEGHIELPQHVMGLGWGAPILAEDLIAGGTRRWEGSHRTLRLDPHALPYAIWRLSAADEA
ncbi:alpha-1,4-glucan--maltose-1-phosphate maltosyltransferase [Rhodovarius crocodyli]|uniref:alpha-1,4-glucan--maltose-1-phosphate maltosyltransferase n=1 Tax=Rhodovarius crocodyli TaxID=1979269 RepID=UPI001F0B720B|nr:alpha-1,4-glucan--maltose-1-phosphate maltosyltransferase [Rhodovarius crocodyli]